MPPWPLTPPQSGTGCLPNKTPPVTVRHPLPSNGAAPVLVHLPPLPSVLAVPQPRFASASLVFGAPCARASPLFSGRLGIPTPPRPSRSLASCHSLPCPPAAPDDLPAGSAEGTRRLPQHALRSSQPAPSSPRDLNAHLKPGAHSPLAARLGDDSRLWGSRGTQKALASLPGQAEQPGDAAPPPRQLSPTPAGGPLGAPLRFWRRCQSPPRAPLKWRRAVQPPAFSARKRVGALLPARRCGPGGRWTRARTALPSRIGRGGGGRHGLGPRHSVLLSIPVIKGRGCREGLGCPGVH